MQICLGAESIATKQVLSEKFIESMNHLVKLIEVPLEQQMEKLIIEEGAGVL